MNINMNIFALYAVYVALLVLDVLAGYFHVIDSTIVTATFTLIVGHFLGLQTNQDASTPSNIKNVQ